MSHTSAAVPASSAAPSAGAHRFSAVISRIAEEMAARDDHGTPADYIPMLAGVDPRRFGMAVAEPDGTVYGVGDWRQPFSTQSISKVFALALALSLDGERIVAGGGPRAFGQPLQLTGAAGVRERDSA
ncbi:glutaminase [Streptomyces sp. Termitarium-T10T-6]|nr:glutaminase [Streptomyces sp. Termitarium-T10T-6]